MSIKLLDCTLRDGGHQIQSQFGISTIDAITRGLEKANIDFIEIGFLKDGDWGKDFAVYNSIADVRAKTKQLRNDIEYTLLVQQDQLNIDNLESYNGGVFKRIRVSFHDYDKDSGIAFCRKVISKGYMCHINPINIVGYSDEEILALVKTANKLGVSVFSMVDTFGAMTKDDMLRIFYLINNNLDPKIGIGIHLHDNMLLAFSLAQTLAEIFPSNRTLIIDASLLGMGRDPGNLCIELIADWLNKKYTARYDIDALLDLIDTYIRPIKEKYPWGYSSAYALSAQYNLHRSYGEHLMRKGKIRTKEIRHILSQVDKQKASRYNEQYIERLYEEYMNVKYDDAANVEKLAMLLQSRRVLALAPGSSLNTHKSEIDEFILLNNPIVITVNFETDLFVSDYIFCSNIRRYEQLNTTSNATRICTSNIAASERDIVISLNRIAYFNSEFWDNSTLLLFNLLDQIGVTRWTVAGFDGFRSYDDYAISGYVMRETDYNSENEHIRTILRSNFGRNTIVFLTPSLYKETL
ncbi:MAG: aldolase catalytic domain-containing protein [Treponema sp.]|jgi:4-hydroxy 2-oxovalerate aldolase|nr:aldolase catalytic domain-containing protein [Treponema sp.]